jgi:hypothetical protein
MRRRIITALGSLAPACLITLADDSLGRALSEAAGIPWPAVIAHRGASHDAPEETAPAYLTARELGADYLEADLQRTRDGVLVALHDDTLERTTDVAKVFPGREKEPVSRFTLVEHQTPGCRQLVQRGLSRTRPVEVRQRADTDPRRADRHRRRWQRNPRPLPGNGGWGATEPKTNVRLN